jgi:Alpha/beta hydrolase domain
VSGYVFEDYIVSGTAAGDPYRVRVQVAPPGDEAAEPFSGHAIVEAIHPQGIPFVWNFTRDYLMPRGHAAVNISVFPNTVETLQGANPDRYGDLQVITDEANENSAIDFDHASDIYAQIGLLLKSDQSPLPNVAWLHMTGHSMSVGPVWQYMGCTTPRTGCPTADRSTTVSSTRPPARPAGWGSFPRWTSPRC